MALFTSVVSLMACGVCNADSDTVAGRIAELAALQAENSSFNFNVGANTVAFPGTFQDLSQQERIDIYTQSYKPFFNRDAYRPINIKDDTAERKSRDCSKVYVCIENYGKAEKEAEDAFFKAAIDYFNTLHFNSSRANEAEQNWIEKSENVTKASLDAEWSPCLCTKELDFAEFILKDLNMSCTEERIEQAGQNAKAYYQKLMEELNTVDEEWIEANKDRTYNNHVVVTTATVKNAAVPVSVYNMDISNAYNPENYHNKGNCKIVKYNDGGNSKEAEENLFIGDCYDNDYVYIVDSDGKSYCETEYVCVLGKSCTDKREKTNFCWFAASRQWDEFFGRMDEKWKEGYQIQRCTAGKWTSSGVDKIPVFIDKNGKVIKTNSGYFPQSIVGPGSYNVDCYAYICKNGTYGCPNGTCPAAGEECEPAKKTPQADSWAMDTKHRNTVKPYLDMLSKCKGSAK